MEQVNGRDAGPGSDFLVEVEQRTKELSQWMDRGGKTRRGFYLAPVLKEMVDGYLGTRNPTDGRLPSGGGLSQARMVLERFERGYTITKAAIAIFNGEPINEESVIGRLVASDLRSTPAIESRASDAGEQDDQREEGFRWI